MEICIYDAKIRRDDITTKWLGNALANIFFYHGTVVKVCININNNIYVDNKTKIKSLS